MQDFLFDIVKREIVLSEGTHGDFVLTNNPSIQNGDGLLYSRGANLRNPMMGVGIEELVNAGAGADTSTYEMNRWKAQVALDGGKGTWTSKPVSALGDFVYTTKVNYL